MLGLSLISVACVFPYVITLQGDLLRTIGQPLWLIGIIQVAQSAVLFSLAILGGLFFAKRIGFHLPLLEAVAEKKNWKAILKDSIAISFLSGAMIAVIIYAVDIIFTVAGAAISTHQTYAPVWQKLLAAVYGGITEEILLRLFLMAFFIWISMKICKRTSPTTTGIVASIFLAAIIFGLGHLPLTASLTALTPLIVTRAIVLNGIGGIMFGWLFWKKGLEAAMIAHFTTDIFLLTLLPLLFR